MKYMINRYLHTFLCNFGYNCTRKWLHCTRLRREITSPFSHAIISKLHSIACNYLYKQGCKESITFDLTVTWSENSIGR